MDLVISLWISDIYGFLWNYRGSVFLWISIHMSFARVDLNCFVFLWIWYQVDSSMFNTGFDDFESKCLHRLGIGVDFISLQVDWVI